MRKLISKQKVQQKEFKQLAKKIKRNLKLTKNPDFYNLVKERTRY